MTKGGIEMLVKYQKIYFPKEWKYFMKDDELGDTYAAYMEVFEDYEDSTVLAAYRNRVKSWKKMPSIAEILEGVGMKRPEEDNEQGILRCSTCGTPQKLILKRQTRYGYGPEWRCSECGSWVIGEKPSEPYDVRREREKKAHAGFRKVDNVEF